MKSSLLPAGSGPKLSVLGDTQFLKVTAAESRGGCTVIEQISRPGSGVPLHVHEREDEVFYVVSGRLRVETEGRVFNVPAGATIFLPRGVPHAFAVEGDEPARLLVIVTPGGIEAMFAELDALTPGPPDLAEVAGICRRYGIEFVAANGSAQNSGAALA